VKWVDTLEPTGKEPDYTGSLYGIMSKQNVPGLQITPKMVILSINSELGKSHVLPQLKKKKGRNFVRNNNGTGDKGTGKKRMAFCNGMHRGSEFALSRKGADCVPRKRTHAAVLSISVLCCIEDEGGPLGLVIQVMIPNHHKLLWSKATVVSVMVKGEA